MAERHFIEENTMSVYVLDTYEAKRNYSQIEQIMK